ncbi:MAG: ATP-grasp domain-containing protein [Ruminococcus flavefaciens]|nr:ATP-grasp domain-containing protein [Ruminococcus flavefaciens]MCM1230524.1 ATP-grasp domain-containing protein [Ruminococcus flavefaciens]
MTKKFNGKKLLVLGSNVGATDIVQYARENGAYVIVADYFPPEKSPAKRIADEGLLISTAEVDELERIVRERNIDGILAGISEFNLLNAEKISARVGLPFYFTREQWDMIENKGNFRSVCEKYGVPCPKTYFVGSEIPDELWDELTYPVMIKPVDSSSSKGVYRCENKDEVLARYDDAISNSECRNIIIEKCVVGDEFSAHYTIANGVVSLASVDNRYPIKVHEEDQTSIPVARIYPCIYFDEYMEKVHPSMLRLCEGLGIQDGILFIQGLYDSATKEFNVFEAGLRSAGEAPYRFIKKINNVNAMHVLVDHALSVPSDFESEKEDATMKGKCCGIVSFVTKGGIVGKIEGLEEATSELPSVVEYECRYPVGSETPNGRTLRQLMIRFVMICESREQMAKDIEYLNSHITVLNDKGEDMVLKMNPSRVFGTE